MKKQNKKREGGGPRRRRRKIPTEIEISTLGLAAATGPWNLVGGTILGGTILAADGAKLMATASGGTLSGVTLKGDPAQAQPIVLEVSGYPVGVAVAGDLTLDNATVNVRGGTHVDFTSAAAKLGGSGTVLFSNDIYYLSGVAAGCFSSSPVVLTQRSQTPEATSPACDDVFS